MKKYRSLLLLLCAVAVVAFMTACGSSTQYSSHSTGPVSYGSFSGG